MQRKFGPRERRVRETEPSKENRRILRCLLINTGLSKKSVFSGCSFPQQQQGKEKKKIIAWHPEGWGQRPQEENLRDLRGKRLKPRFLDHRVLRVVRCDSSALATGVVCTRKQAQSRSSQVKRHQKLLCLRNIRCHWSARRIKH